MANITIKGIPGDTLDRLKNRASKNRRSLNKEIIQILDIESKAEKIHFEELMEKVEKVHARFKGTLSESEITKAKQIGRA